MFCRLEAMSALCFEARREGKESRGQRGKSDPWRVGKSGARAPNEKAGYPYVAGLNAAFAARTGNRFARTRRRGATRA